MYGCLIVCLYVESVYSARMQMEKQEQARGSHDEDIHDTPDHVHHTEPTV